MTKIAIGLLIVTNLGAKSIYSVHRDKDGLIVNGLKIQASLIPNAVDSYGVLLPRKFPKPIFHCSAGTYELTRGNVKEKGCLEGERGKKINAAIFHLERLAAYAQSAPK